MSNQYYFLVRIPLSSKPRQKVSAVKMGLNFQICIEIILNY